MDLVQMQQFVCVDNKKKDIPILGEGPTQVLDGTMLTAEKKYSINLLKIISFVYICIKMEQIVIYLVMIQKLLNLKQQILKLWQFHFGISYD